MEHVVTWLNDKPTAPSQRDNNKPPLRLDLVTGIRELTEEEESKAKQRLKLPIPNRYLAASRTSSKKASFLLQQEVIEYVLDNIQNVRSLLESVSNGLRRAAYAGQLQDKAWKKLLTIVSHYATRNRLLILTSRRQQDARLKEMATKVSRMICIQLKDPKYDISTRTLASSVFQAELGVWLLEHVHDGMEVEAATQASVSHKRHSAASNDIADPYDFPDSESEVGDVADEGSDSLRPSLSRAVSTTSFVSAAPITSASDLMAVPPSGPARQRLPSERNGNDQQETTPMRAVPLSNMGIQGSMMRSTQRSTRSPQSERLYLDDESERSYSDDGSKRFDVSHRLERPRPDRGSQSFSPGHRLERSN